MLPIEITSDALDLIRSTILDRSKRFGDAIHPSLEWASSFPADGTEPFVTVALSRQPFVGDDWLTINGSMTNVYNRIPYGKINRAHQFIVYLSGGQLAIRKKSR